jgi:hypothetical protein
MLALVFIPWVCYLDYMKSGGKAVVWLLAGFAMACNGATQANNSASSTDGPYRAIVDRNVFDLRAVPPVTTPPGPETPPPNVKLIGLMSISGHPQGVFSVQDPTPGKQPVSYILADDQRQGTLEVKSINMDGKSARVQIGESIVLLKLEDPKAPTGPAPAAAGALAAGPGQRTFVPGGRPGGRGAFPLPAPGLSAPGQPAPAGGPPSASYSPDNGNGGLPTRPVRTDAASQQTMTPEQQVMNLEQTREQYLQNGDPRAAILPPSPITAAMQASQNGGDPTSGGTSGTGASTTPTGNQLPVWLRPKATGSAALPMPGQ